ncbi:MAG: cyclic nucleotide-binding domain-containing protein [Nitrospinae bacterium]|nr:cyclic nucleotide-binding domain-containing protein [Nitrospinota bacterium]
MTREKDRIQETVQKLSAKGKWDKAAAEFKKLAEMEPRNPRLRLRLGELYVKARDKEAALREYGQAARQYEDEGDLIKAIAVNKVIVRLDPSLERVHRELAELYSKRGLMGDVEALSLSFPKEGRKVIPLFSDLRPDEFSEIVQKLAVHKLPAGAVVIREGQEGSSFFIIIHGQVRVSKKDRDGEEVILATLGEDAFFGEIALLSGKARIATVVTETETELLELTRRDLDEVKARYPRIELILKKFLEERLRDTKEKMS